MLEIIKFFRKIFCVIFAALILIIFSIVVIPIGIYRKIIEFICIKFCEDIRGIVPPAKNIFWQNWSQENSRPLNICIWSIIEGQLEPKLLEQLLNKILSHRDGKNNLHYQEFQEFIIQFWGYTFWKWDKNFNVKNHYEYLNEREVDKWGESELKGKLATLLSRPFKKGQSPWEVTVIENYGDKNSNGEASVIVLRLHHVLGDGYSFLKIFQEHVCEGEYKQSVVPQFVRKRLNFKGKMLFPFRMVFDLGKFLSKIPNDKNDLKIPFGQLKREYHVLWTPDLDVGEIKRIKNYFGVSFQAVIVSIIGAGIQNLMGGDEIPQGINCFMPLPLPNRPDKRGFEFHVTGVFVQIPVKESDPVYRLTYSHAFLKSAAKSASVSYLKMASLAGRLPFLWHMADCVRNSVETIQSLSIFPGLDGQIFVQGQRVLSAGFAINPSSRGNSGASISSLTCFNRVKIVLTIDQNLILTQKLTDFENGVQNEIERLLRATTESLNTDTVLEIPH